MIVSTDIFNAAIDLKNKLEVFEKQQGEKLDSSAKVLLAAVQNFLGEHSV